MYESAIGIMSQPAFIKEHLPIAYVAEKAGIQLRAGEGRMHALCPFHPDSDPSLDIYPWRDTERFGCFACGAGGDVLDFIQRMWGLGFREACEMGLRGIDAMKAEGWEVPKLGTVLDWDPAAAHGIWSRGTIEGLETIVSAKGWVFPASHLLSWHVRRLGNEILVPVMREDGALVGLKHRPLSGARSLIALPGSQLRQTLYGAHQAPTPTVLLVEGESDAWTASWQTRDLPFLRVLSLPAGAGAAPTRLDLLRGQGVIVALDGDDAGRTSAARWMDALGAHGALLELPNNEDITSLASKDPSWLASELRAFGAY